VHTTAAREECFLKGSIALPLLSSNHYAVTVIVTDFGTTLHNDHFLPFPCIALLVACITRA